MKHLALAVVLAAGLFPGAALACTVPAGAKAMESGLIDWINGARAQKGLARLKPSGKLDKAADAHACDMASRGFFSHKGPGGPTLQKRLKSAGYRFSAAVENIGKSRKASADTAAGIWRNSSAHWANILNPSIRDIGVAVATDGSNVYYVFVGGSQ